MRWHDAEPQCVTAPVLAWRALSRRDFGDKAERQDVDFLTYLLYRVDG